MSAPIPTAQSSGFVYADVPNRVIAYIIDAIIMIVILIVIGIVLAAIGLATNTISPTGVQTNYVASFVAAILGLVVTGVYFVYTWTTMRATIGMKLLGMQIGNAGDGATLTTNQAIRRFLALSGPSILAQVLSPIPLIGLLLSLVALGWVIFLLYTTAQSPTKQGWHDVFAHTQVVKAARSV
jgi:uncharacterized RDD family membrane protein YckC